MSTITEVVDQQLRAAGMGNYRGQAQSVVTALEAREQAAVESLMDFATQAGLSRESAREAIEAAGLRVQAAQAVNEASSESAGEQSDTDARLARLEESVTQMLDAARSRGLL